MKILRLKLLNGLLILASLFGYLEWGGGQKMFLFEGEIEVVRNLFTHPSSATHPFTLIPMIGQALLLITLFQRTPGKTLTISGLACVGLLLGFMSVIGVLSGNLKILLSTIPFLVTAILVLRTLFRK